MTITKSIDALWEEFIEENGDCLAECSRELVLWHQLGVLQEGLVRHFARKLIAGGFPAGECLKLAEKHVEMEALVRISRYA